MSKINGINLNSAAGLGLNLYTKRNYEDNSEMYIASKLDKLYKQAISKNAGFLGTRSLRQMVEGNYLDKQA